MTMILVESGLYILLFIFVILKAKIALLNVIYICYVTFYLFHYFSLYIYFNIFIFIFYHFYLKVILHSVVLQTVHFHGVSLFRSTYQLIMIIIVLKSIAVRPIFRTETLNGIVYVEFVCRSKNRTTISLLFAISAFHYLTRDKGSWLKR